MEKIDLQKQATMLIKQLSTEKLKAAVDYLSDLQGKSVAAEIFGLLDKAEN